MQDIEGGKRDNFIGYKKLDKALSRWAKEMKKSNGMITASMAKQKAEELSSAMGYDLKPSTAWLYKWKDRENIKFAKRPKNPHDILKEFLDKMESKQRQRLNKETSEELNHYSESKSNSTKDELLIETNSQNQNQLCNERESENKQRTKRDYVKRLPIIDASGLICRSRKEKTFLTLLQKLEILQRLKNGERRPDLIIEYNLSHSAMSQIVTDERRILELAAGGQNLQMKRIRGGIFKNGEAELNAWVRQKMENGESLTRTQIKNRAKEIAERLNIDFKASTGWLEKWKARMNLDFNENQKLQRKYPIYMSTDEEYWNRHAQFEHSDSLNDQANEILENQIKDEHIEDDYCHGIERRDEFNNSVDGTDVKNEVLTPQQFYLQTLRSNSRSLNISCDTVAENNRKEEEELKTEDNDVKPFISTPLHIFENEEIPRPSETLHHQILNWLTQHNIAPIAASELLNILKPHFTQ